MYQKENSCCFTGHRPMKLPWGMNESDPRCIELKAQLASMLEAAYEMGYRNFICGMAIGCDMYFAEVIESGDENVWIYRFENGKGKSCYALWCPTMDDIRVNGYTLNIDGTNATLTEFANKEMSGISSALTVTNGTVTVNVGERPILVFSE